MPFAFEFYWKITYRPKKKELVKDEEKSEEKIEKIGILTFIFNIIFLYHSVSHNAIVIYTFLGLGSVSVSFVSNSHLD